MTRRHLEFEAAFRNVRMFIGAPVPHDRLPGRRGSVIGNGILAEILVIPLFAAVVAVAGVLVGQYSTT